MKFVVTASIASLALASLGYAAPAADPAPNSLVQRSPTAEVDWRTMVDRDYASTLVDGVEDQGTVMVSAQGGWPLGKIPRLLKNGMASE